MKGEYYTINVPVEELMEFHDFHGRVIGHELITVNGDWDEMRQEVHEGDEIVLSSYVPEWPEPVIELHAIVTGFNEEVPGIEVIV